MVRAPFTGVVLGASARSALVSVCGEPIVVVAAPQGRGPSTVRLAALPMWRMDDGFVAGEACRCADGQLSTARLSIDLRGAAIWRTPRPVVRVERLALARRLLALRTALAVLPVDERAAADQRLDDAWIGAVPALRRHCREGAFAAALAAAGPLIGCGCGSTPSGDDFLVGLLAGLGALACGDPARGRFLASLAHAIAAEAAVRTTALSAQHLRHAADGDFGEPLACLRDAMIATVDESALAPALVAALAVGASSGIAGVAGLASGIEAWIEPPDAG